MKAAERAQAIREGVWGPGVKLEVLIAEPIKRSWGPGPWVEEADRVQWVWTGRKSFPCLIVRHEVSGTLNGYVGVPRNHLFYGEDFGDDDLRLDAHGGITYAGPVEYVTHYADDDHWWFGFDTAHWLDIKPAIVAMLRGAGLSEPLEFTIGEGSYRETYKTLGYVQHEVERLARQLALRPNRRTARRVRNRRLAREVSKLRRELVRDAGRANRTAYSKFDDYGDVDFALSRQRTRKAVARAAKINRPLRLPRSFRKWKR